jgi:hypothetical protein
MTWVGMASCGHALMYSCDPEEEIFRGIQWDDREDELEEKLDTYKSLLDDIRHYLRSGGSVKVYEVGEKLPPWCDCKKT